MAEHFVQTKCALMKRDAKVDFKVVTYESHKRKAKEPVLNEPIISVGPVDTRKGIDIKRARREIIKFGITGFSHERQQEAKVSYISLISVLLLCGDHWPWQRNTMNGLSSV